MKKVLFYAFAGVLIACHRTPEKDKHSTEITEPAISAAAPRAVVFPWLQGKWIIDYGETKIYEHWEQNGQMLTGRTYVVNNGRDTVMTELMHIQTIGNSWVFIAKIDDHDPVLFTSKNVSTDPKLIFENSEHDFPQTVTYAKDAGGLYASIEGKEKGKARKEEFNYKALQ